MGDWECYQRDDSIWNVYVKMTTLLDQLPFMSYYSCVLLTLLCFHIPQEIRIVQFLKALWTEFEHVRSIFLHWSLPLVDMSLSKLLLEEQTRSSLAIERNTDVDNVLVSTFPARQPGLLGQCKNGETSDICNYLKQHAQSRTVLSIQRFHNGNLITLSIVCR